MFGEQGFAQEALESGEAEQVLQRTPTQEALLLQVEEMRRANQSMLSTVHWTLGTVAAIAALLVGYSWFVNFRISTEEKERLRASEPTS
jgi:hypothetical protein